MVFIEEGGKAQKPQKKHKLFVQVRYDDEEILFVNEDTTASHKFVVDVIDFVKRFLGIE